MAAPAMPRRQVVFTDGSIRREALDLLSSTCDVRVLTQYASEQELIAACADSEGIMARLGTITGRVIEQAPRLRIIARQALGFGMRVLAADPHLTSSSDPQVELTTLHDLLARADVVTLHTRLSDATAHLIEARAFAGMKRGACLVNTARGELVDEVALTAALSAGALAGAALDTYEREPLPADSPLRGLPNVVLSPHVAGRNLL
jgi:phosphoglycerate dehydrogenase-like enzyme